MSFKGVLLACIYRHGRCSVHGGLSLSAQTVHCHSTLQLAIFTATEGPDSGNMAHKDALEDALQQRVVRLLPMSKKRPVRYGCCWPLIAESVLAFSVCAALTPVFVATTACCNCYAYIVHSVHSQLYLSNSVSNLFALLWALLP